MSFVKGFLMAFVPILVVMVMIDRSTSVTLPDGLIVLVVILCILVGVVYNNAVSNRREQS